MRYSEQAAADQELLTKARYAEEDARDKAVAAWAQAAGEHEGARAIIELRKINEILRAEGFRGPLGAAGVEDMVAHLKRRAGDEDDERSLWPH